MQRRRFLSQAALGVAGLWGLQQAAGAELPAVTNPRATSGDPIEPNWDSRLTITVGPKKGDLIGSTQLVIQAAVDTAARLGGGTVKILPGEYTFRNAVYLPSGVRIVGSGLDSVVKKAPSVKTKLTADSDWYDQEITLENPDGFQLGDGVFLHTKNPHNAGTDVVKRTLVARQGNRFKLNQALRQNFWLVGEPTAATLFPLFSGENIANVVIEDLAFDGNKDNNENLNGNYGGCIFLQDCNNIHMRRLTVRNYNGDGISWQICHDVVVEDCHSHDNADLGLHPGSGSQRPLIRNNKIENATIGIFFCWGVRYGLAEGNTVVGCRDSVSIGHCDTDNIVRKNRILDSKTVAVVFRHDNRGQDFDPHRNRIEENEIVNSGPADGVAIDVQGTTQDVQLVRNTVRETRAPMNRIGIRIGEQVGRIAVSDNNVTGVATELLDLRKNASGTVSLQSTSG